MRNKLILVTMATLTLATVTSSMRVMDEPTVNQITEEVTIVKPTLFERLEYEPPEIVEKVPEIEDEIHETVTYRVTAYCACEKCCGKWALRRPKDENGNPIVYGAAGVKLVNGVSCAGTLPFRTRVELDGYGTVEVQDRFANWIVDKYGENIIDIYFDDHATARNFGEKYLEGVIVNDARTSRN